MNLFVLEDIPVVVSSEELEGIDGKKENTPEEVSQESVIEEAEAIKAKELTKAAEEEKMLEEKDKAAEEEKVSVVEKESEELKQLRGNLAELMSNSSNKEGKLLEEIETLKAKLAAKYSFLECGVKVKKVSVENTEKVVNIKVQDLVESMVDQVPSNNDVKNDLALNEEDKSTKDDVKRTVFSEKRMRG